MTVKAVSTTVSHSRSSRRCLTGFSISSWWTWKERPQVSLGEVGHPLQVPDVLRLVEAEIASQEGYLLGVRDLVPALGDLFEAVNLVPGRQLDNDERQDRDHPYRKQREEHAPDYVGKHGRFPASLDCVQHIWARASPSRQAVREAAVQAAGVLLLGGLPGNLSSSQARQGRLVVGGEAPRQSLLSSVLDPRVHERQQDVRDQRADDRQRPGHEDDEAREENVLG